MVRNLYLRPALLIVAALLTGCAAWSTRPLTEAERRSIATAEDYVLRNGYTLAGHPEGLPVMGTQIMDIFSTPEELVERRRGLFRSKAAGIVPLGSNTYYVLFDREPSSAQEEASDIDGMPEEEGLRSFNIVLVQRTRAVQIYHVKLDFREGDWKPNDR